MRKVTMAVACAAAATLTPPLAAHAEDFIVGLPTTPPNIVHMATILADDLGLYKKYGITVKFVALDGGVKVYRAMIAGSLDIALAPGAFSVTGVSKGADARIVYVNTPKNEASLVANANVKDMADLKGKRIGIQQPGGFADINARAALRAAKIDPKDVSFVSIATEDVPALVANQVDTGVLHVEQEMLAKSKAPGIHAIARMWELQPKTLYLPTVVADKTIKEKADKLKAYIKANMEATRLMYTDKAKVLPVIVKHTGYPAKIVEEAFDFMVKSCIWDANTGIGAERVDFTSDLMTKVGNIEKGKTPKYDQVVHAAIAKDALKEVGEWKGPICPSAPF